MKITVTGSLGNIGLPLTKALIQKGHAVTVITTNPDKQQAIESLGATTAIGTLTDVDFLVSTFTGADAVYCMIPPAYTEPDPIAYNSVIGRNYLQALRLSGAKRLVYLSSWGAHLAKGTGVIAGHHDVEKILRELNGVNITFLRPCSFYNNLYHYVDMIKRQGFIGTNYGGDDRIVLVSPRDIAAAAKEELETITEGIKIRYVASAERSCNEIAAALGNAIGKPDLQWLKFTDEQVTAAMQKNGGPPLMAALLVELNASIRTGIIRSDYDLHPPVMGKVTLEDFANEFALAFK